MNPIKLYFMVEKREGLGEDSNPLSIIKDDKFCAVGVFDGMGGSGAATCKSEYGPDHTKAYVASRIVRNVLDNYIKNCRLSSLTADAIKQCVKERLDQERNTYPAKTSALRSRMVRDYPTTLAITTTYENENGTHTVNSYWAGDSRNYLWTMQGFYQISKDDLDTELDPLENLRNDGALSNCVCADRDFNINCQTIKVKGKFLIMSATDGCFNYFTSPMHFQDVLLSGLLQAETKDEWKAYCEEKIAEVTGDDYSLSLMAIGFEDFNDLKNSFLHSEITDIKEIKDVQNKIQELSDAKDKTEKELENLIQEGWNRYKVSYLYYLNNTDDADAIEVQDEEKHTNTGAAETIPAFTSSVASEETCEEKPYEENNTNEEVSTDIKECAGKEEKPEETETSDGPISEAPQPVAPTREEKDRSTSDEKPDKISFEEERMTSYQGINLDEIYAIDRNSSSGVEYQKKIEDLYNKRRTKK